MRAPHTPRPLAAGDAHERDARGPRRAVRIALRWLRALLVLACVVAVDQLSKRAVEHSIVPGEEHRFLPGVELVDTRNHGVAFGLFPGDQLIVTVLVVFALLALLVYFALHVHKPLMWLPTGMIAGGALGNVLDRARHGSVTDFVKLPLGWPPFNLADASITLGVLILVVLVDRRRERA
ncbi:MAG TPA: signal peptidase II [Solirubrobacteraceae bacterium]|nr:signal peptidase II [Solirubrobacteraceae bacterium]